MIVTGAICDKCQTKKLGEGVYTKKEIIVSLRKNGWSVGKRTICPECRPKPKRIILEY